MIFVPSFPICITIHLYCTLHHPNTSRLDRIRWHLLKGMEPFHEFPAKKVYFGIDIWIHTASKVSYPYIIPQDGVNRQQAVHVP